MKKLFIVLSALVASTSFAAPKVGDIVNFEGSMSMGGNSMPMALTQKLVAFDATRGSFTLEETMTLMGQSQTNSEQRTEQEIVSEEMAGMIVGGCESQGIGKLETVTVKAGTFNSCKVEDGSQTIWIAAVPFGAVKMSNADAEASFSLELASFARGQ